MTEYHVICPNCRNKAVLQMKPDGTKGTYREPGLNMVPIKLICPSCGYVSASNSGKTLEYEFWYKTSYQDKIIWARSRDHLNFLVHWLSGDLGKNELKPSEKAYIECLPKWMINKKNRSEIVHRLKRMLKRK